MLTLGFSNEYYTVWNVYTETRYGHGQVVNGKFNGTVEKVTVYNYMQNLSKDYDAAKVKIAEMSGGKFEEDLDLRGETYGHHFEKVIERTYPAEFFSFGKLRGEEFATATDIWQLHRAMDSEPSGRARVNARKRLIELGNLRRYDGKVRTIAEIEKLEKEKKVKAHSGHFFQEGEKVTLEVMLVEEFSFPSQFGYTYITTLEDKEGRLFKYMGGRPPRIEKEFVTITATIKHDNYKGLDETKLQRIKIK